MPCRAARRAEASCSAGSAPAARWPGLDRLGVCRDRRNPRHAARPGGCRSGHGRRGDGLARSVGGSRVRPRPTAEPDRGSGACVGGGGAANRRISESAIRNRQFAIRNPPSRRHRLRQDRDLPARDRRDAAPRPAGGGVSAGDRVDAADDPPLRCPLPGKSHRLAQRTGRRRAFRRLAASAHEPSGCAGGGRLALCVVPALPRSRADSDRRGA